MGNILESISGPQDIRDLDDTQLEQLAAEIRDYIVTHVSTKGGHFASNLGSVELTLALHKVYNTPTDKLIWDVGHQAYPHKLITGRYNSFHSLKTYGGLSGFLKRSESEYDVFGAGHASTSIAAAMGFARAMVHNKKDDHVVAVIGDGSLTGGMAYEALNNAGVSDCKLTIVLNDNTMSIAPNVGAVHKYLTKIIANPTYNKLKDEVWELTGKFSQNFSDRLRKLVRKVDEGVKHMVLPGGFFEDIGIRYFGPIDGHNIAELTEIFENIKDLNRPSIVHVITEKGRGWQLAEKDSYKWHASTPFDPSSGVRKATNTIPSFAKVFGQELTRYAKKDPKIIAITAAMPDGVGLDAMQSELPEQVYDVGIAEQYAVTFAAGLACEGITPVCAIYSTFLQRAFDQVIHDVAIQNLNVVFAMSHSGLVGVDGPTHHGAMDLSYLRMIPNMVIMAPADENDLKSMLLTALEYKNGPIAFRFPKGNILGVPEKPAAKLKIGEPETIESGDDIAIVAVGHMLHYATEVGAKLKEQGYSSTIVNARFVKPLSEEFYKELFSRHSCVLTVEDNVVMGGFGSGVSELMSKLGIYNVPIKHVGIPDKFVTHGSIPELHAELGMDANGIYKAALELIKVSHSKMVE